MPPAAETVSDQGAGARTRGERPGAVHATGPQPRPPRIRTRVRRSIRGRAAAAAALLTSLVFCLGGLLAGSHPFGPTTRNTVDLGQQYLPYHAYWRKFLLGGADGDLFLNWNAGFGSNFLGDYGTYLSSPFALLVVVFPADRIELALYVVTAAKIATAGAAMAVLLLRLRRGPWQVAAVLGAAYALCGWTLDYGATVPMWLDGLVAFPLLCLVGEWARTGRHPVLGPVVVGLAWYANFYTAYMATLGAAVVLAVRLLTDTPKDTPKNASKNASTGRRQLAGRRLAGLLRASRAVLLGVSLAAPLVLVVFLATRVADPTPEVAFSAVAWTDVLGRLLPAAQGVASPALFIGTPALALALTLPFNSTLRPRLRTVWTAAICLVALSLQWAPTHLLWHAGTSPNGIPYRQTFVLCGLLVIAGWLSTARGLPPLPALLGSAALLTAVAFGARRSAVLDHWTYPVFAAALALSALAAVAALLARRGAVGCRALAAGAVVLLVLAQAGEAAITGARIEERRLDAVHWSPRVGPWQRDMARAVAEQDAWPHHRTDPGEVPGGNDALLVGGQSAELYSSLTSETYARTLSALGFGFYAKGRHPVTLDHPVTDAIFSVGTRMRSTPAAPPRTDTPPEATITATRTPVPPLVTVRPRSAEASGGAPASGQPASPEPVFGASVFANQESLLGSTVYDVPKRLRRTDGPGQVTTLTATCRPHTRLSLWAPELTGTAALNGQPPVSFSGRLPAVQGALRTLGTVPASGEVRIELRGSARPTLPPRPVGCLDRARLDAVVRRLTETGATAVRVTGHSLSARLPAGSTGTAVIAVPRVPGWRCAAGDAAPAPARRHLGLLAVPIDPTTPTVTCTFRPPGLRAGAAIAALAFLALLALGFRSRFPLSATRVHLECTSGSSDGK
ncbi:YfhO family protein [Streptomyces sp. P9(2023)]|uniref:YfhO family protein n=1 Tax=Streptomyces sp. P9(2023) TaxID=3064394 RepID=UPI0028F42AB4|nr:YfhO family protein [Streptomyces sp. P9(2023)]MDT9690393.1 YfhO family protein [Streptomyces sp. P9(2023)]